jgi:hypothetical protein
MNTKLSKLIETISDTRVNRIKKSKLNEINSSLKIDVNIPTSMIDVAKEYGISNKYFKDVFNDYIKDILGIPYSQEADQFINWCEDPDNIADYIDYQ